MPQSAFRKFIVLVILVFLSAIFFFIARPKIAATYFNYALSCYDAGAYDKALDAFKNSLFINSKEHRVYYMMGLTYESKGMPEYAISYYKKSIEIEPSNLQAYTALSEIYYRKEMYKEVFDVLSSGKKIAPNDLTISDVTNLYSSSIVLQLLNEANEAFSSGDKAKAYDLAKEALSYQPDSAKIKYTLIFFDYSARKDDKLEERLWEIINMDPSFAQAYELLGDIYFKKADYKKAIEVYRDCLNIVGGSVVLNNSLAIALNRDERYKEAEKYFKKALEADQANLDIRYGLAANYRDMKDIERAISEYEKIVKDRPESPNVYNDLGDIYQRQGNLDQAQEVYTKAVNFSRARVEANPRDPVPLDYLAHALNNTGKSQQAKELIDKLLNFAPGYGQAYLTLSQIYENLKDFKKAKEALLKAKEFFGDVDFIRLDFERIEREEASK